MTVVDLAILVTLVIFCITAIKRGVFQLPARSKRATVLIVVGLLTIVLLSVVDLVVMHPLPSLPPERETIGSVSDFMLNLYHIGVFFAFVFIGMGFLRLTRGISRTDSALAGNESGYRTIVEDQTDLIVRWNIDGIRTWVNDSYCEYIQQPREVLVGTSFFPLIPETVIKEYLAKFRALTPEASSITEEILIFLPDGSQRWQEWTHRVIFSSDGKLIECQSIGRDITVRKTAESALMDSEIRYRNLVENTTDWVWQVDLKGNHTYTNSQLEVILGYDQEEFLALSLKELFHPEDVAGNYARISSNAVIRHGWQNWLLRMQHKDGSYRYLDSSAVPLLDSSGAMIGFSGIDRDVTFKTLLAEATTDLLAANLGSAQIEEAMRKFAEHFHVDRFEMRWRNKSEEATERTFAWSRAGVEPAPSTARLSEIPLASAQMANGKVIQVADTGALSAAASAEREVSELVGSRAFVLFPLKISIGGEGNDRIGSGLVDVHESTRNWTEEEINELQLAFSVIATSEARLLIRAELKDRERFHALVADVSTDLLKVSVDDSSLTQALHRFAVHFKVDSLGCWWFDEARESIRRSCSWFQEGLNPGPSVFSLDILPYYWASTLAGEVVRVSDANDLPAECSAERALHESLGVTAALLVPMNLGAELDNIGSGVALDYGDRRDWNDQEVEDLQIAFNVIAIAEARKQTENELQGRERFRTFLAEISTNLLGAHQDEIGDKIDICLQRIAKHYNLDRAGLWFYADSKRLVRRLQGGVIGGEELLLEDVLSLDLVPWTRANTLAGIDTQIESLENIPSEQEQDRNFYEGQGMKSVLTLPLAADHQRLGVGVFTTVDQARSWTEKVISELRLLSEVIMNAYSRAESTRISQQRERDLTRSEALANVGSYSFFPDTAPDHWPPSGRLALSEEMRKLLDFTAEEAVFDDFISRIHIDDRARVLSSMHEPLQEGSILQHEYRLVRPNGEIVHVEDRTEVNWSGDGHEIVRVFASLKNISERVLRENELRDALAQIEKLKENLEEENLELRDEIRSAHGFNKIIGNSRSLQRCLDLVKKVAPTDATVMLLGETGTGKELIAHAVHDQSARKDKRMVSVNCAALPESLIESELFGHEKGAFTGAVSARKGRFELADGGTLFLDEIGELPLPLQSKLLRAIQEGEFERLGGSKTLKVDVRLIAATNRQLKNIVDEGDFRADLYYRISNFPIEIPSLKERKDDIPLLAEHFVRKFAPELGKNIKAISSGMLRHLTERSWPGNVRELEGFIQHALITNESDVLTLNAQNEEINQPLSELDDLASSEKATLSSVEHRHIIDVLNQTTWMISGEKGAAKILGVPPSTLRSRMKKLGIEHPDKSPVIE